MGAMALMAWLWAAECPVTPANGRGMAGEGNHGNGELATGLSGNVLFKPGGPGCVDEDGSLGMKWFWWRRVPRPLSIEGRRLDGEAPPLRASIPAGYRDTFQSSALFFATPGCWEVTGRVGEASLTFVTRVTKIGEGPSNSCRRLFGGYSPPAPR